MKFYTFFLLFFLTGTFCFGQKTDKTSIVLWNKNRPLKITDFKIIEDAILNLGAPINQALTRTGITYKIIQYGKQFDIRLNSTMFPDHSHIRKSVLKDSSKVAILLKHEQNHFDISEIFARRAVKRLSQTNFSKNFINEVKALMQQVFLECNKLQDQYDFETRNGREELHQLEWNERIAKMLKETAPFQKNNITKTIGK